MPTKMTKTAKRIARKAPRKTATANQNGNGADSALPQPTTVESRYLSQIHVPSRVLTAASLSRDRAPLRSVEVPGLGPDGTPGVVFYRPHSTADFLRLVDGAETAKDATPIEQIRFLVDHLAGRWCDPATGQPYTRDEILALEPSNLALISNAILFAREIAVDDHESLLRELGVPLAAEESTTLAETAAVLSPNASGGAPSSAGTTV